jgi:acyl-CoA thioesterase
LAGAPSQRCDGLVTAVFRIPQARAVVSFCCVIGSARCAAALIHGAGAHTSISYRRQMWERRGLWKDRLELAPMTTAYARAMTFPKSEGGSRLGRIDPSWHTGRGAFGGLVAAATLRSMTEDVADVARVPRSLTVHFCAPAAGDVALATEVVRIGSRVTHATARVASDGKAASIASASFCKDRPDALAYQHAAMPEVEPASEVSALPAGFGGVPAFFQHFDVRFCGATRPFASGAEPTVAAWVRLREPAAIDAPLAAMLLDVLPPAITATFATPRSVASVDFTIHLFVSLDDVRLDPEDHHLVAIRSRWAGNGYTEEVRDLWSRGGVLIGQCRQLLALL